MLSTLRVCPLGTSSTRNHVKATVKILRSSERERFITEQAILGESHREPDQDTHNRYNAETQVKPQAERGGRETVKRRIGCRNVLSRVTVGVGAVSQSHIYHHITCQLHTCTVLGAGGGGGACACNQLLVA